MNEYTNEVKNLCRVGLEQVTTKTMDFRFGKLSRKVGSIPRISKCLRQTSASKLDKLQN